MLIIYKGTLIINILYSLNVFIISQIKLLKIYNIN